MGRLSEHKLSSCAVIEEIHVTWLGNIRVGELHLQTTHVVPRIIIRFKSTEILHFSLDFHFIMTNLEGILITHLKTFTNENEDQVSTEVSQPRCTFHRLNWRQTVKGRDSIRAMEDSFQSTAEEEKVSRIKTQGLEIINRSLIYT